MVSTSSTTRRPRLRTSSANKGRLRLVVVQALVLSLFVTLFARLWYMQVLGGEAYQAQAAEQSIRELVVQPARGLIVDDMGRPLVANRTSWVVSLDRTMLHKMSDDEQATLLGRLSKAVDVPAKKIEAGQVAEVPFNGRLIFVLHDGSRLRALDATCSHLACRVKWKEKERQFHCDCHGGKFAANGDRIAGPPPKGLREQAMQVGPDGRIVLIDEGGNT